MNNSFIFLAVLLGITIMHGCQRYQSNKNIRELEEILTRHLSQSESTEHCFIIAQENHIFSEKHNSEAEPINEFVNSMDYQFFPFVQLRKLISSGEVQESTPVKSILPHIEDTTVLVGDLYREQTNSSSTSNLSNRDIIDRLLSHLNNRSNLEEDNESVKTTAELLRKAYYYSSFFDKNSNLYPNTYSDKIPSVNPTWFAENTKSIAGWQLFTWNNHTVLWNSFKRKDKVLLLLKMFDKGIFTAVLWTSDKSDTPLNGACNTDLLQSHLALKIIKEIYEPDYKINYAQTKENILQQFNRVRSTGNLLLHIKELVHKIKNRSESSDKGPDSKLISIYQTLIDSTIGKDHLLDIPKVSINYVVDNSNWIKDFKIAKDTTLVIRAQGQAQRAFKNPRKWYADILEVFFDPSRIAKGAQRGAISTYITEKQPFYVANLDTLRYRCLKSGGHAKTLRIDIPWSNWNLVPKNGMKLPFAFLIRDFDLNVWKSHSNVMWSLQTMQDIGDASKFGVVELGSKSPKVASAEGKIYASYHDKKLKTEPDWNSDGVQLIENCVEGDKGTSDELNVKIQCVWSSEQLTIWLHIYDNIFVAPHVLKATDWSYIVNKSTGEPIWKFTPTTASANFPVYSVCDTLRVKAGEYQVFYSTDKKHAINRWLTKAPFVDNYGIQIYY